MKKKLIASSLLLAGILGISLSSQMQAQECPELTSYMIDEDGQCIDLSDWEPEIEPDSEDDEANEGEVFQRIASFPVFLNTDIDSQTVAEIVSVSKDGNTLIYTDSETENIGFVDIRNPASPRPAGVVAVGGEPTSVVVKGRFALVGVNTSESFVQPSGKLVVVDIRRQRVVREIELGGQPDSVAISPNERYAAIAIENERDEDLGDGRPPQQPGGFLVIVETAGSPRSWTTRSVDLDGVADLFPNDPEPEYVDINQDDVAVVTLQENNYVVLVDLPSGNIVNDWSAGTADLSQIDTLENSLIELNSSLSNIPREPDGVTWLPGNLIATADEGDLDGGSRGFTLFDRSGRMLFTAGNSVEQLVTRIGHYPEERSENKGNEPENVTYGQFGRDRLLFVGSERSSVVLVYRLTGNNQPPELLQILPTGVAPEGLLAIPKRNLFVVASEEDSREDGIRSAINIYRRDEGTPDYPKIASANGSNGLPIPWGALSDLAVDPSRPNTAYTVYDSFYQKSRIFALDISQTPALLNREIVLRDTQGQLAAVDASLVNPDQTVNLDPEGVTVRADGGFWVASEGAGTVGDPDNPFETLNLLLRVEPDGAIAEVVTLPAAVNSRQVRFGYEGVASIGRGTNEDVYVAFQREWAGDPENRVRIGRYDTATGEWAFFYYPIEDPTSPNGGWVGLSSLTPLGNGEFLVVERDNQAGADARIKRLYRFSVSGLAPTADPGAGVTPNFPVVNKRLVRDLIPALEATGGLILEKIEGSAVLPNGTILIVNDNDGVDDSNGETQLIRLSGGTSGDGPDDEDDE
ncbi:esterase-like activity of phytase family protein [Sphaerothrix gracilis]|uniref:esterase-like activity of phytase family protein n=1 Tax=Sphaerothrix gracilis TaxID=3151835 RepID=UPI0031FC12E9